VRKVAIVFLIIGAAVALQAMVSVASLATDGGELEEPTRQAGEDRWVPSLAITSGVTIQQQQGFADSFFEDTSPTVPIRGFVKGKDTAVSPFVGGTLELMTPALPITTRPRLFVSGEILPTFASDRDLVFEGDPSCVSGPEPEVPCATNEPRDENGDPIRVKPFDEDNANGQGTSTITQVDTLVFGASLGVAFPLQVWKRQLRIKPSIGWINYKVEADASVVHAACADVVPIPGLPNQFEGGCTDTIDSRGDSHEGFLRQPESLTASDSQRFNGIGPGLDVEMDTGRYGPLGVSLFMGGRAYAIVGDRTISFGTEETYDDQLGTDRAAARFEVEVDRWIYRAHVGIRFHWLGSEE
jgi:hypothetical protein